jgi:hypothetical protein
MLTTEKKSTRKAETLRHWQELPPAQNPLEHMQAIEYQARGSRYGACGIRIDGTPEFIDAVLSNLKQLLAGENCVTRLELSRARVLREQSGPVDGRKFVNAEERAECCYIRLHQRGRQALPQHQLAARGIARARPVQPPTMF